MDHRVCVIGVQRPKCSGRVRTWVRWCVLDRECARVFDLHIFHADPLVIGENGPHRHCVDTLLFLWGGEKMEGNLTTEISWLFHYTVCAACIVTPI